VACAAFCSSGDLPNHGKHRIGKQGRAELGIKGLVIELLVLSIARQSSDFASRASRKWAFSSHPNRIYVLDIMPKHGIIQRFKSNAGDITALIQQHTRCLNRLIEALTPRYTIEAARMILNEPIHCSAASNKFCKKTRALTVTKTLSVPR
jgi:hypothetical protein